VNAWCYDRPQQNKNALIRKSFLRASAKESMCHRLKAHAAKVGKGTAFEQQPIAESFFRNCLLLKAGRVAPLWAE
jgi:hypothetical protein